MAVVPADSDTLPKLLLRHAAQRGERPAYREKSRGIWRTMTWRGLADEAAALAAALSERGLKRGAHVALIGDNRPRLYAAMSAVQSLGAVAVPLYQDASADELVAPIQRAEITHVFAENQEQVDKILSIIPKCPTIQCVVYDKDRGMRHYKQLQLVSYDALLKQGKDLAASKRAFLEAEIARGKGEDAAFLFFTSGTTGPAKGVVLTHASMIDRARAAAAVEGLTDTDVAMAYLPPGWIGQNLFAYVQPMVIGYCICCPESSDTMLADMREMGPSYFLATPRVLEALLTQMTMRLEDAGGFNEAMYRRGMAAARRARAGSASIGDRIVSKLCNVLIYGPLRDVLGMSKLKVAYTAGDAIEPELLMLYRSLGINLKQLYGSAETGFFVTIPGNGDVKADSVGRAAEGVEIRLSPEREILVRSPGLFKEYYRDADATAKARNDDGWFRTGDVGVIGEDGHLRIVDRIENVGALNDGTLFAPRLIENKLKLFPYIRETVSFGDRRDYVSVLIDVDFASTARWADKRTISYTGHADLASRDEVYDLIAGCIAKVNAELAADPALAKSQIRRFAILQKELSPDEGLLTRTGKLRRHAIAERFKALVDAIYGGRAEARTEFGDGASADVKIRDARTSAAEPARRAA